MAVDDAYNAREYREGEGDDEIAWRIEHISRRTCRAVAEFAFQQARRMHGHGLRRPQVDRVARSTRGC